MGAPARPVTSLLWYLKRPFVTFALTQARLERIEARLVEIAEENDRRHEASLRASGDYERAMNGLK